MAVVVDASVVVVLTTGDPRRALADKVVREWLTRGEEMHAPTLLTYEVASAMTRLVAAGAMTEQQAIALWPELQGLPITYHPPGDGARLTSIALQLQRQSAYDAAYLALAEDLGAELWAFDGPLVRNAAAIGRTVRQPR
jgi:predicted nucleic acid-binding protein